MIFDSCLASLCTTGVGGAGAGAFAAPTAIIFVAQTQQEAQSPHPQDSLKSELPVRSDNMFWKMSAGVTRENKESFKAALRRRGVRRSHLCSMRFNN